MKKIISIMAVAITAMFIGCTDTTNNSTSGTNDKPVVEPAKKASLIINAKGSQASKSVVMKDATNSSILPSVVGLSCDRIEAAAFAYEPKSSLHSTNYTALANTNSPTGNWSAYYFMPTATGRIIKQGDITDVSAWNENPDDLLSTGFESNYASENTSFSMDIIALSMKCIHILVKEGTADPDISTNYTLYGSGTQGFDRYPEYEDITQIAKTITARDSAYKILNNQTTIVVDNAAVLFVNKDIFTDIDSTTLAETSGNTPVWCDNVDRPVSGPILKDFFNSYLDNGTTKIHSLWHCGTIIIIPYDAKKIIVGDGVSNADVIAKPVVSITFDIANLIDTNSTWDGSIGGLYTLGYDYVNPVNAFLGIKSDLANGFNPFGMNITISE